MTVRLKDIARDLGVSVITVSKALRDHSDISAETKAILLEPKLVVRASTKRPLRSSRHASAKA